VGKRWHLRFTNSSHTCPTHHPIGGMSGKCMVGICTQQKSAHAILTAALPEIKKISRIGNLHARGFIQFHQHIFPSHLTIRSAHGITNTPFRNPIHRFPTHHALGGLGGKLMVRIYTSWEKALRARLASVTLIASISFSVTPFSRPAKSLPTYSQG